MDQEGPWVMWVKRGPFSYKTTKIYCWPNDPGSLYRSTPTPLPKSSSQTVLLMFGQYSTLFCLLSSTLLCLFVTKIDYFFDHWSWLALSQASLNLCTHEIRCWLSRDPKIWYGPNLSRVSSRQCAKILASSPNSSLNSPCLNTLSLAGLWAVGWKYLSGRLRLRMKCC